MCRKHVFIGWAEITVSTTCCEVTIKLNPHFPFSLLALYKHLEMFDL